MTSLSELYGTMSGPSRSDIRVAPQPQQPGVVVGPSPRDIQFAQGPITGPTRPQDIAFAVTPEHLRRAAIVRALMARRAHPHVAVEVGTPQIETPHYSVDVGEPIIADQVVARGGPR